MSRRSAAATRAHDSAAERPPAHQAVISLGSNISPERCLPAAVELLGEYGRVVAVSQAWQSRPVGFLEQADFVNAAVLFETSCSAEQLLSDVVPRIEGALHRVRDPDNKNAPRTIDLDLSLFNSEVSLVLGRTIPDPDLLTRLFVAWPVAEIVGEWLHPVTGDRLREIAERLRRTAAPLKLRADIRLDARRECRPA